MKEIAFSLFAHHFELMIESICKLHIQWEINNLMEIIAISFSPTHRGVFPQGLPHLSTNSSTHTLTETHTLMLWRWTAICLKAIMMMLPTVMCLFLRWWKCPHWHWCSIRSGHFCIGYRTLSFFIVSICHQQS